MTTTLSALENQVTEAVERLSESVVSIDSVRVTRDFRYGLVPVEGKGSGLIIDRSGYVITNNHVIDESTRVQVHLKVIRQLGVINFRGDGTGNPQNLGRFGYVFGLAGDDQLVPHHGHEVDAVEAKAGQIEPLRSRRRNLEGNAHAPRLRQADPLFRRATVV